MSGIDPAALLPHVALAGCFFVGALAGAAASNVLFWLATR